MQFRRPTSSRLSRAVKANEINVVEPIQPLRKDRSKDREKSEWQVMQRANFHRPHNECAAGGVMFTPTISDEDARSLVKGLCERLSDLIWRWVKNLYRQTPT